jgi:hypothetical protein
MNITGLKIVKVADYIWHQTIHNKAKYSETNFELQVTLIQDLVNRRKIHENKLNLKLKLKTFGFHSLLLINLGQSTC